MRLSVGLVVCVCVLFAHSLLYAQSPEGSATSQAPQTPKEFTEEDLVALKAKIDEEPQNLDHYFTYAKAATTLGKFEEAEAAYLFMLEARPSLNRVKLDLALLYSRLGQNAYAKELYEEVLAADPPPQVRKNIELALSRVEEQLKQHRFSGTVMLGFNADSNANAAPSSEGLTFLDQTIPLEDQSRAETDHQYFGVLSANHGYRFDIDNKAPYALDWNSSATFYRAEQVELPELNLALVSVKTGPKLHLKEYNTKLGLNGGYNFIKLDGEEYLHVGLGELTAEYRVNDRFSLNSIFAYERRRFVNSPTNTTLTDRTGHALQGTLGATYALSTKDLISANASLRKEMTQRDYFDNVQWRFAGNYTRIFPFDIFLNLQNSYRTSDYESNDPFVSSTTARLDREYIVGLTVGKKLWDDFTWTLGYQYKSVNSNLQNFEYDNHRVSTSIGWSFSN